MEYRKYNIFPNKKRKTMSGRFGERTRSPIKESSSSTTTRSTGFANVLLQAEEKFKTQASNDEWKVQKGKKNRSNKPKVGKKEFDDKPNYNKSNKRPFQNSDNGSTFNKRHDKYPNPEGQRSQSSSGVLKVQDSSKKNNEHRSDYSTDSRSNSRPQDQCHMPGLSYTKLQQLSSKDPTDLIRTLANSRSGLDEFLKEINAEKTPDQMYLFVKILSKLTTSDWEENKEHVLVKTSTPEFFKKIREFVFWLVTDDQNYKRREDMEQFFNNLLTVFQAVITILPTVAAEHLLGPLRATKMAMNGVAEQGVEINANLHKKIIQLISDCEERIKEKEERERVQKIEKEVFYPKALGHISNFPLYPRPEDIANTQGSVVPNKVVGPYNNVEHYLDIQFRLLREDFIAPVRQGINEFKMGKSQGKKKINNIRIFRRVKFIRTKVIGDKVGYDICFDPEKRYRTNWEYSKCFIFGSLLLFTTDNFHSFFLATVVKRDLAVMEKDRIVSVVLCDTNEVAKDLLAKEFIMAESEVYFEPYYNVLKALQRFNSNSFPMTRYIVYVEKKTNIPAYTRNGNHVYTITTGANGRKTFKLFEDNTWPSCTDLDFDVSQLNAFKSALTNDLVVIQGPPGTGKTFLGLKIAAALLENSIIWNSNNKTPILVLCYTNHALDQFLEGILENGLTDNIIRIGGRSKSELLEPFNLKERRRSVAHFTPNYNQAALLKDLKREMSDIFESIKALQDNLEQLDKHEGILSLKTLKIVMSDHQSGYFRANFDLLHWLLLGIKVDIETQLISSEDKHLVHQRRKNVPEDFEYDQSDFENYSRLKEVLFDNIDLEETNEENCAINSLRISYSITLEEILKKIEETSKLLESLPAQEKGRDVIKNEIRHARKAEQNLKTIFQYLEEKFKSVSIPSHEDTDKVYGVENLNTLSVSERWILYKSWIEFLKAGFFKLIQRQEEIFRKGCRRYEEVRQFDDLRIVQQADVVGMTTTTAARLQAMLRELRPKIVIVEEAAEVLEAHIVASLSVHCQHLILIGDHKQLRPSPADYRLGKDCFLDISLFERLIKNGVNYHTLTTQHRMRPEISKLLVPNIYPTLCDHSSTLSRPKIRGMETNVFFMNHQHFEAEVNDIMSKKNPFEARLVMSLARHLLLQGYKPDEITVLTTYKGQMYLLKEEQKRLDISKDLLVTVVDNFQGEENKIILLSLVRSNADNRIGFLKTENRVCVALSRARDGLYIFGNMDCLAAESVLWQRIRKTLTDQHSFGPALVLHCEMHPTELTRIVTAEEFSQVAEGGCRRPCGEILSCGHPCQSLCHVSKDRHNRYQCRQPCIRKLCADGHPCLKKCYQECGLCIQTVKRTLDCGHQVELPCHMDYRKLQCKKTVTVNFPLCGHDIETECYREVYKECPKLCPFRLECGHACTKTCHIFDDPDHLNYSCPKPCARKPPNCTSDLHTCPLSCFEKCRPCELRVTKQLNCGHSVTTKCGVTELYCRAPCNRELWCGHPCKKMCVDDCGDCDVQVEKVVPLCGHKVKIKCSEEPKKGHCTGKCQVKLSCGHNCKKRCKDTCSADSCEELVRLPSHSTLPCGHSGALLPCNLARKINLASVSSFDKEELVQFCSEPCNASLGCEHKCTGTCGQCMQGRIHKVCDEDCNNTLICGHSCPVPCRKVCPPCEKPCQIRCEHSRCPKKCGEPCSLCQEPCEYRCEHSRCSRRCGEMCDRQPCTEPCLLILACTHPCVGFCGEPCPPCRQCEPQHFEEFFCTGEEEEPDSKWILLNDCKHVLEATGLEYWLGVSNADNQGGSMEIKPKTCPKCRPTEPNRYIVTTQRYMNLVKETYRDIQAVKEKVFGQIKDIRNKREGLLKNIEDIEPHKLDGFSGNDEFYHLYRQLFKDLPAIKNERRNEVGIEQLTVLEFTVEYFTLMVKRKHEIWSQLSDEAKLKMKVKINMLTNAVLKRKKKISSSEIESIRCELNRITRFGDLCILESSGEFKELKNNQEVIQYFTQAEKLINQFSRYTKDLDKTVFNVIENLKKVIKSNATLSPEVMKSIHKAMYNAGSIGLQGHWFKCPNGHPYAIGDCGGAMVIAKCPEKGCGAEIGGKNHRYLPGQQLFSEMDGATRPAWSTGNDMANFDLNNLH